MLEYREEDYKAILRIMEQDLLALLAIDLQSEEYEVIYSDGAYRNFENRYRNVGFFQAWKQVGLKQMDESDRGRMEKEISKEYLAARLKSADTYTTICRFLVDGKPAYCRIRIRRDVLEPGVVILSIRNINTEIRQEQKRILEMEEMIRRESVYRDAILADAAGVMEINLTANRSETRIYDNYEEWMPVEVTLPELGDPIPYDAFKRWFGNHMLLSDKEEFLSFCNCVSLIESFHEGKSIASIEYKSRTVIGTDIMCREIYYMSLDQLTGDVRSFCVLYDLTRQRQRDKDVQILQEDLQQMKVKNFISQMRPHFLYNALSSIREIVLVDPEYGADMLYDFTTYLRAGIRAIGSDEKIPFVQELENIRAYVNIEIMRLGDRLQVSYDIQSDDFEILPLSIQPIVENAIRHGIYEKNTDDGKVLLKTEETEAFRIITVEDNGVGFDAEKTRKMVSQGKKDSTGLQNLIFRLEKMMNASVEIYSEIGMGTTVIVRIPK